MNIYTKTGDKGTTSLFDNVRVSKDDIRVESYGTVDELGSFLGLAKNYVEDETIYNQIQDIQNKLFTVATNLATEDENKVKHHILDEDISNLESLIDLYMGKLNNPTGFIVPGSSKKSSYLHVARTVCRRVERRIISLSNISYVDPLVLKYVNRLSDTLYAMARYLENNQIEVKY
ncbi:cob(I)yrinic acid a,c-diamide adenosyltransferase [Paratissierella segnis]|jgi:cob(I)alamin adenosyltransferase|uniref:Corrinoid adenosyltransferase n=1 Tax=Paratissierella segnis TaxID=2763679 RepID=A0A926ETF4_9FIRM|nr:cob(I)yrinic acid a,c-diamide adenosyltransferase [Paratissierella segnis]MBC8587918.1 cob(I)yrinic acid a,c-diamide adenosyltransferase [Paratissierella segnis]